MVMASLVESTEQSIQLESKTSTTTPRNQPFTTLPDLCLIALFRELPLVDQITAKQVNLRWYSLAGHVTKSRRRLTLLANHRRIDQLEDWINYPRHSGVPSGGSVVSAKAKVLSLLRAEDGRPLYTARRYTVWSTLQFDSLSNEVVSMIVNNFSGIKELQLAVNSAEEFINIEHLVNLLGHWQNQLTSLFLFNGIEDIYKDNMCNSTLISAVNSLSALKCFTLYAYRVDYDTFDLPIIGQLEELNLRFYTQTKIPPLLSKYGDENRALTQITVQFESSYYVSIGNFRKLSPHLRNCITQLDSYRFPYLVPDFFLHFRNLTSLNLSYSNLERPYPFYLSKLSQLTHLIHLHLIFYFRSIHLKDPPYHLQQQIKSVRALELVLYLDTHEQLPPLSIAWLFPNVEAIHFRFSVPDLWSKCTQCKVEFFPDEARQQQVNPAQVKHCMRQIFAPFKRDCTKLRAILHDREGVFGTANELLGQ